MSAAQRNISTPPLRIDLEAEVRNDVVGRVVFGPVQPMSEYRRFTVQQPVDAAHSINELKARVKLLEEALIRCAELAGADGEAVEAARSGAQKYPSVEDFAINVVAQLREDYDRG